MTDSRKPPSPPPSPPQRPAAPPFDAKAKRRSSRVFYLVLVLILLALPAGYSLFLMEPPPPPAPPPAVAAQPVELRVSKVEGSVEVKRPDGQWAAAKEGEALKAADGVRTGTDGAAVLTGGDQYEVRMEPQTEVAVDELKDSISRIMLGNGMATASVRGGKHSFEVRARNSDAVAKTRAGTFAMSSNDQGTVAVGTRDGEVEFAGAGKTVIVRAGQQSVVVPGQAPSAPSSVPTSLLLRVNWPAGKGTLTKSAVVVSGQSEPGAIVFVQGRAVPVDAKGKFSLPLKLTDGKTELKVRAKSVSDLTSHAEHGVEVDTRPPTGGLEKPDWGGSNSNGH